MPLTFHPVRGTIVICDFSTGFQVPEMIKIRPVVIMSPRFRHRENLCTIVPLSTTPPNPVATYHHRLTSTPYPPADGRDVWAKCDMIATVGLGRLDRVKVKQRDGRRVYTTYQVSASDLEAIVVCIKKALAIED
jgi:uncharacterized protein YifN (PemK superfamily)